MGIVRNCIDIIGITPENELPSQISGQHIEVSETENLFIDSDIEIKNVYQIIIESTIKGTRVINTPMNKIVVIDGCKKFKIAYYDVDNNMGVLELNSPYNLFFDIENNKDEIEKTNIYIADAYFEPINKKVLYCNILYIADIHYFGNVRKVQERKNTNKYFEDKISDKYYVADNVCKNKGIKDDIYSEMLISEYDKRHFEEDKQVDITENDKLIDIDSEYL